MLILLLCIHPLFITPNIYIQLTHHKFIFFLFCMITLSCFTIPILLYQSLQGFRVLEKKPSLTHLTLIGFLLVTILSAILSPYKTEMNVWLGAEERYDGVITQVLYIAVFLIIACWYKVRERDFLLFAVSVSVVSLIGILQAYKIYNFGPGPGDVMDTRGIQFLSTLGNINMVSAYACIAVLFCGFLFIRTDWSLRYIWLVTSLLCFWLLIIAASFSGLVGTAAAVMLAIPFLIENRQYFSRFLILIFGWVSVFTLHRFLYNTLILGGGYGKFLPFAFIMVVIGVVTLAVILKSKNIKPGGKINWKLGITLIAVLIITGIIFVEIFGRAEDGLVYQAREIMHGNIDDEFATKRVYIWRNALSVMMERPVIGSGPDTFGYVFPIKAQYFYDVFYDKAHNEYLQILICQGFLGLILYLVFLFILFTKSILPASKNPLLMAALAAFTGFCVQAFFNISTPIVNPLFWVLAGVMSRLVEHETV